MNASTARENARAHLRSARREPLDATHPDLAHPDLAHPSAIHPSSVRARPARARSVARRPAVVVLAVAVVLLAVLGASPLIERAAGPVLLAAGDLFDADPEPDGPTGVAGGEIPDGAAGPGADLPAVTGLDPELHAAVRRASADATADGVDFWITSGWRSPAFQQSLFDEAVRTDGLAEARRSVATPETSRHIGGNAVDIGPTEGAYWLIEHGADYGLCQAYAHEIWHFERLTEPGGTCPPMLDDATG